MISGTEVWFSFRCEHIKVTDAIQCQHIAPQSVKTDLHTCSLTEDKIDRVPTPSASLLTSRPRAFAPLTSKFSLYFSGSYIPINRLAFLLLPTLTVEDSSRYFTIVALVIMTHDKCKHMEPGLLNRVNEIISRN